MAKTPNRSRRTAAPPPAASGSRQAAGRTARNSAQARRERARRRRRHLLLFRLLCCVLVCAAAVLATTVFFRVSKVEVAGDTRYTAEELIDASGVQTGDNMFFLDSSHIISILQAKYPYLNTVSLHRRLPSTLEIEVSDRVATLSLDTGSGYLLVDSNGKVLDTAADAAPDTAVVSGTETDKLKVGDTAGDKQEKLKTVLDLMNLMTQYEMNTEVRSVDIEKAYDVRVQYTEAYTILLGNMDDLEHKIQFLQAILKEPSLPESGIIDLTDDKEARYRPADSTSASSSEEQQTADDAQTDGEQDPQTSADGQDSTQTGADNGQADSGQTESDGASDSTAADSAEPEQQSGEADAADTQAQPQDNTTADSSQAAAPRRPQGISV